MNSFCNHFFGCYADELRVFFLTGAGTYIIGLGAGGANASSISIVCYARIVGLGITIFITS